MKKLINFLCLVIVFAISAIAVYSCQADIQDLAPVIMSGPVLVSTNYMRGRYVAFKEWLVANGKLSSMETNAIITPTALRVNANLLGGDTTLTFNLKKGTDTDAAGERRLANDNVFFVTHMAILLQKYYISGATNIKHGNYHLYTYPDPNYFAGVSAGNEASEADSLNTVYDGKFTLNTAGVDRLFEVLTEDFKFVPDSQYLLLVAPQTGDEHAQWGPEMADRGWVEMHGNQVLIGNLENKITLTLGEGSKDIIQGVAAIGNRVVFKIKGFEFSGSFPREKGGVC